MSRRSPEPRAATVVVDIGNQKRAEANRKKEKELEESLEPKKRLRNQEKTRIEEIIALPYHKRF